MAVKKIPDGFHTITPHLVVNDAKGAIDFYKKAFNAEEINRSAMPGAAKIMHAMIRIGDSFLMLNDEFPDMGGKSPKSLSGTPVTINLYVDDADRVFNQATKAGAQVVMPLADQFWGDRYGILKDPYGHQWSIATHTRDVSPAEMEKAAAKLFSH